jgi:hypothetical protein
LYPGGGFFNLGFRDYLFYSFGFRDYLFYYLGFRSYLFFYYLGFRDYLFYYLGFGFDKFTHGERWIRGFLDILGRFLNYWRDLIVRAYQSSRLIL